jgi:penicillin-insensitive murein endopeptidase
LLHRLALAMLLLTLATAASAAEPPAKELFGAVQTPAVMPGPTVIGSYAKGCLANAVALPADGPGWAAMRLSRNRDWGHPRLIDWITDFSRTARQLGWPGLLIGDLGQARGGPMATGHASHQIGLDVDIWLTPRPNHTPTAEESEQMSAVSMLRPGTRELDKARFDRRRVALLEAAATSPEVERIFVHPAIKQALCQTAGGDRAWLRKLRPWWGHDDHFHVRLACPPGEALCKSQEPPPAGEGCGADLAWWFTEEPWKPQGPPPKPLTLADLPAECAAVLNSR